ncbi:hypothetical protein LCGC14_2300080, partial [marine sediment metagenome]
MGKSLGYEYVKKVIGERGGEILSSYTSAKVPIKIRCSNGHIFYPRFSTIQKGTWCRECFFDKRRKDIHEVVSEIEKRGGKLLSDNYVNTKTKISVQCKIGHIWLTTFSRIHVGGWCPKCATHNVANLNRKYSEKYVKNYFNDIGWVLLSRYNNVNEYINWIGSC